MNNMLFVPSIQHTGTWFTIKFLESFGFQPKEAAHIIEDKMPLEDKTIIHTHFPILRDFDLNMDVDWWSRWQLNLMNRSLDLRAIRLMLSLCKTVIPLRDPLASILTREERHPHLRHFFIIDGFVELAQLIDGHPNVKFLPIDLYKSFEERKELLIDVLIHCGINYYDKIDVIDYWAENWPVQNVTPNSQFSQLYKIGNITRIKFLLGPKWAEVKYLKNMASIILPFLASKGYTKGDLNLW